VPRKPTNKYVALARERHQRDLRLARRKSGHPRGYYFDEEEADRVVHFFSTYLRHHKGEWAGEPFVLADWQADDIIRPVFGWMRPDGQRRFRVGYTEVPRKNGKSTVAAGVGLYLMMADGEPGAEVYSTATKQDQAKIVFEIAKQMLRRSPELSKHASWLTNNIHCDEWASKFEPLGADAHTLDGLNPHGNIVDELHAHRTRQVWDVLMTALGARRQPLTFAITTAGLYDPESIGWEQHEYARKVLEGDIEDDEYFAFISCADENDDWTDPALWEAVNPNYGVSVKPDYLAAECKKAEESPAFQNTFLRYHTNIWTQQVTRWIDMRKWNDLEVVDPEGLRRKQCYAGIDLAATTDIAALALLFPRDDGGCDLMTRFWVPEETARSVSERRIATYNAWAEQGALILTPGNVIDYDFIRNELNELSKKYRITEVGYDPWNATKFALECQGDGFRMMEVRQGFISMSEPSKAFEKLVMAGGLRWDGNAVMRWMVSNVTKKEDPAGNIKPDKSTSTGKIDGVVAAIIALSRHVRQISGVKPTVRPHSITRVSPNKIG
jgi:phage terminase large subunit-like protein